MASMRSGLGSNPPSPTKTDAAAAAVAILSTAARNSGESYAPGMPILRVGHLQRRLRAKGNGSEIHRSRCRQIRAADQEAVDPRNSCNVTEEEMVMSGDASEEQKTALT